MWRSKLRRQSSLLAIASLALFAISIGATTVAGRADDLQRLWAEFENYPLHKARDDNPVNDLGVANWRVDAFELWLGEGGGLVGYDTLHVRADGACELFMVSEDKAGGLEYRRSSFKISDETIRAVREALVALDVLALKAVYDARVADGSQRFIRVAVNGRNRQVWCSNHSPERVGAFFGSMKSSVVMPHREQIADSMVTVNGTPEGAMPLFAPPTPASQPTSRPK